MSTFTVITRSGQVIPVEGRLGVSVMEHIRDAGLDELLALCGGCCSCATCHVYIDDDIEARLPKLSNDEDELLDSSDYRKAQSRLSCQLPFTPDLEGMIVILAPED
ncbi:MULTISPECIES: 2Fe-2S iron-sulfur cluster-binding protein [unclassified Rhizobium]|uniref:2Fe-2S iron-sulfur cluster-binding protein n=1 Tax=unclassified Rhizobium TaxID=2613769 RepID=UPI00247A2ADC|nr:MULTISPECIES: 2Fe-2S iron-sulfur cluster-binding protein [unclassified Rhizobium]MDH7804514.1 ferredoxin [Rhizobium sp. AN70]